LNIHHISALIKRIAGINCVYVKVIETVLCVYDQNSIWWYRCNIKLVITYSQYFEVDNIITFGSISMKCNTAVCVCNFTTQLLEVHYINIPIMLYYWFITILHININIILYNWLEHQCHIYMWKLTTVIRITVAHYLIICRSSM